MKKLLGLLMLSAVFAVNAKEMKISSEDFKANKNLKNEQLANSFGCSGGNLSPQLSWDDAPKQTKSFAVTVYDPDAPTGSGFWHWITYDINPKTKSLAKGASDTDKMPEDSVEILNDAGTIGYLGACPPKGDAKHRYQFTVYALDVDELPVTDDATSAITRFILNKHVIGKATITAYAQTK